MQLDPKYKPPSPPFLITSGLPVEDETAARSLSANLNSLSSEANNVAAAVALFAVCRDNIREGTLFVDWMRIAARDGAMSIRNFGEALSAVRSLVGLVKSWLPLIDTQALKNAEVAFNEKFPFAYKLRHSVAHPELFNKPTKKMGIDGSMEAFGIRAENVQDLQIQGMISDFTYASTFEGVLVQYNLTGETIEAILSVINQAYDAFCPAQDNYPRMFPPRQED